MKLIANSNESEAKVISTIKSMRAKSKYLRVTIATGRDRTEDQNSVFHSWVQQLTVEGGEMTFNEYRNFCRLHFFVPVLIASDVGFADLWWSLFDKEKSKRKDADQYRTQLHLVGQITGITSKCTTIQFNTAMDNMQKHFATLENDPVFLEYQNDEAVK